MKILYLCADPGIPVLGDKGAAIHVREMVAALGRAGHNVVLATQLLSKSPWDTPAAAPSPLVQVPPDVDSDAAVVGVKRFNELIGVESSVPGELRRILYNKHFELELKRRFEAEPPDLLYERACLYSTAGALLARLLHRPLLVELNAPLAFEQAAYRATGFGELAGQAERWSLNQADAVVVVSAELREHVLALGVEAARIHVIPNGVNPALFHSGPPDKDLRARWQLNGAGPLIGFVGGLRPWHGIEALPGLLAALAKDHPAVRLIIVGDGPLRADLEHRLEKGGLRSHAIFTGLVPHETIPRLIREFDLAVAPYPPTNHAFYFSPLKLFEYMACGIPVVAAGVGQISEVLREGETGLMYPPGDLNALTNRCAELLADATLRERLGHAGAALVRSRYTWDHNAARITHLAQALAAARRETVCRDSTPAQAKRCT